MCVAALLVGSRGRVIGVDVTPAMAEKGVGKREAGGTYQCRNLRG